MLENNNNNLQTFWLCTVNHSHQTEIYNETLKDEGLHRTAVSGSKVEIFIIKWMIYENMH